MHILVPIGLLSLLSPIHISWHIVSDSLRPILFKQQAFISVIEFLRNETRNVQALIDNDSIRM